MPLPPVFKHITSAPTSTRLTASISSTLCHLRPKSIPSAGHGQGTGKSPGMYHNLFVTDTLAPSTNASDLSESEKGRACLVAENGINFRVTDIAPRTVGHMHKTSSLDFLVVHRGSVTLHLEGGAKQRIREGEAIVQRGTVHTWENETDEWVRMFVVLVAAKGD